MSNTPLIEVTNLSLKLNNADILSSITITSTNPGVTMVMGPNGAGKSLFLRCLHGLAIPTSGSIKIFGNTILGTSTDQAMVFQKPVLLKRSVIENLKFAWPKKTQRTRLIMRFHSHVYKTNNTFLQSYCRGRTTTACALKSLASKTQIAGFRRTNSESRPSICANY